MTTAKMAKTRQSIMFCPCLQERSTPSLSSLMFQQYECSKVMKKDAFASETINDKKNEQRFPFLVSC
jgi:hypothetical protein